MGGLPNELKGADLRRAIRERLKPEADKAHKLAHQLLETLIAHGAELYGQVIIKVPDDKFNGTQLYAEAMMRIAKNYHQLLDKELSNGLIVADIIISSLLMPLALAKFGEQVPESKHKKEEDLQNFKRYEKRLKTLCRNGSSLVAVQSNHPDLAIKFL